MNNTKRIVIIGGVAAGASCATRLRRLNETYEIVIIEKGPHVSFANCGLPYFVGDVITEASDLLVATPEIFQQRFNIDVRVNHEVIAINRCDRMITIKSLVDGEINETCYDALVLATGSKAIRPPLPGIDLPGIYVLRTIPDSQKLRGAAKNAQAAIIIGGGFIGLEMAENLVKLGLAVTMVEMAKQIMPPLDAEMAIYVQQTLEDNGVLLKLGQAVSAFHQGKNSLRVCSSQGQHMDAEMVLMAIGVVPESDLAKQAGLAIGERGGIQVTDSMQTTDQSIWAVGDVIEVNDVVTQAKISLPLAGPASRQGRIAANSILGSLQSNEKKTLKFRGVQGTAVCQVFGTTIAMTGATEKALARAGVSGYQVIYLHPGDHVGYFPGARPIHLKLIFDQNNGKILGAQAIGEDGVARRIDVIAMAIQMGATVFDLEESELCYAPQFGAAKDPVNMAGMIASNVLRGDLEIANWHQLSDANHYLLDVRTIKEYDSSSIDNAIHIPMEQLRDRIHELPRDKEIWTICGVGQRAYYATRLLMQHDIKAKLLSGGMATYQVIKLSVANQ